MRPKRQHAPLLPWWHSSLWTAILLLSCSCMTRTLPKSVVLEPAVVRAEEYPYMISAEATFHVYFNPHSFGIGNTKVPEIDRVFLKRDSGVLGDGDFFVAVPGGNYPMKSRGRVVIDGNTVTIDAELGEEAKPGSGAIVWSKCYLNGRYQLIRPKPRMAKNSRRLGMIRRQM